MSSITNHPYHLVEKRPWPIVASIGVFLIVSGLVNWFQTNEIKLLVIGLISTLITRIQWWRDVSRERTLQGLHTIKVVIGLKYGMLLFIVSEVLFFFSFFWAFFHRSLNREIELGLVWPPTGVEPFNPFQVPLLNTLILLASGVTVTWAHHAVTDNFHVQVKQGLTITLILGVFFTALQAIEYLEAPFTLSDSVYGSTFFVATGFHGLHVIIGSLFLAVCLYRNILGRFRSDHHIGLEAAIWYWHFVDVVWLFLFISIYWWGS